MYAKPRTYIRLINLNMNKYFLKICTNICKYILSENNKINLLKPIKYMYYIYNFHTSRNVCFLEMYLLVFFCIF